MVRFTRDYHSNGLTAVIACQVRPDGRWRRSSPKLSYNASVQGYFRQSTTEGTSDDWSGTKNGRRRCIDPRNNYVLKWRTDG
nr:MAG: VP4 protein [Drosophila Crammond virga-like virus]